MHGLQVPVHAMRQCAQSVAGFLLYLEEAQINTNMHKCPFYLAYNLDHTNIITTLSMRTLCVTCLFCLQSNRVKQMTIHSLSHRKPYSRAHIHISWRKKYCVEKHNKTIRPHE